VALAGPAVSLALMVVSGILAVGLQLAWGDSTSQGIAVVGFVAEVMALFNVFLAITNLVPGYPLDGARIVHAVAWSRSGREDLATAVATRVGRIVGLAVMALGGAVAVVYGLWPGLALALAGWLLVGSSRILDRRLMLQALLTGTRVGDAADSDTPRIPPQLTLDVFAGEYLGERLGGAALVERGQELLGVIGTAQIKRVARRNWQVVRTEQVMVPIGSVQHATADSDLWPALETLERSGQDALVIGPGGGDAESPELLTRRSVSLLIKEKAEQQARLAQATLRARGFLGGRPGDQPPPGPPSGGPTPPGDAPADPSARPPAGTDDDQESGQS
jgi:hypothetical protein